MSAGRFRGLGCLLALAISGMPFPSASMAAAEVHGDSVPAAVDSLPLAPAVHRGIPPGYPALTLGFGLRSFNPDFSGLSGVYGGKPSFRLSPLLSGLVRLYVFDFLSLDLDAAAALTSGENDAYHGMAGVALHQPLTSKGALRAELSAGVAVARFHGEESGTAAEGGATGVYASAGVEAVLSRGWTVEVYGGYCAYPEISSPWTSYAEGEPTEIRATVDLSRAFAGVRVAWPAWEW